MTEFIENLFQAMYVMVLALRQITFNIENTTLNLFNVILYIALVELTISWLRDMSGHGLFRFSKKGDSAAERIENGDN